jgi:hypothetical protein
MGTKVSNWEKRWWEENRLVGTLKTIVPFY